MPHQTTQHTPVLSSSTNRENIKSPMKRNSIASDINISDLVSSAEQFISQLYQASLHTQHTNFHQTVLCQLSKLMKADAAIWCHGHLSTMRFHTYTTVGVPSDFANRLIANWSDNPILIPLIQNAGHPIDIQDFIPDEIFFQSACYQTCFQPFQLKRALSSMRLDIKSGFFDLLTIYRKQKDRSFDEQHKNVQKRLSYHLREAAKLHYENMLASYQSSSHKRCLFALCDSKGFIFHYQPHFFELLAIEFNVTHFYRLPSLLSSTDKPVLQLSKITVYLQTALSWKIVAIRKREPLDKLTIRQQQVVNLLAKGFSYKQIAIKLNLAPSTVANHLYQTYKKLNITSRSQLQDILATVSHV